jgi:hypothetical protein
MKLTLHDILANRQWLRCKEPFLHFTAQNVFVEPVYRSLEAMFQRILSRGLGRTSDDNLRLTRNISDYDAYSLSFPPDLSGPLRIFISRPWHDMVANLTGVNATRDIHGGLHHHAIGSASGRIHNDLNPGWFVDRYNDAGINAADWSLCNYRTGDTYGSGLVPRATVRAAAMLFYLNNPPWSQGDGGETGLYRNAQDPIEKPAATVPPVNNSILIFECTPYSYHSFISNRHHQRNSVILWIHRPRAEAVFRWGEENIVNWPNQ